MPLFPAVSGVRLRSSELAILSLADDSRFRIIKRTCFARPYVIDFLSLQGFLAMDPLGSFSRSIPLGAPLLLVRLRVVGPLPDGVCFCSFFEFTLRWHRSHSA